MQMKLSVAGLQKLANEEGVKPWVYDDGDGKPVVTGKIIKGFLTFGMGHLVRKGEKFPMFPQEADHKTIMDLAAKDVAWAEAIVNKRVTVPLTQNQFDALVSLVFNIGDGALPREKRGTPGFVPGFQNSTLLFELNKGNYEAAANHILDWKFSKGKPMLLPRRLREKELFLAGVEPKKVVKVGPPGKPKVATSAEKSSKAPQAGSRKPQGKSQ